MTAKDASFTEKMLKKKEKKEPKKIKVKSGSRETLCKVYTPLYSLPELLF